MSFSSNVRLNSDRSAKDIADLLARKFSVNDVSVRPHKYSLRLPETAISVVDGESISKTSKKLMADDYHLNLIGLI